MSRFRVLAATSAALLLLAPAALADPAPSLAGDVHNPNQALCLTPPSFEGLWRTHTSANGHFDLRLTVSGDKVTGVFTTLDGQPQYNGTLEGTMLKKYDVNSFEFTYVQPQINARGKGNFEQSGDGKRIAGVIYPEGPKPSYFNWDGERVVEAARGGDPSGFVGMWTGANSAFGQFTVALGAGSGGNGALQGNINGAFSAFVQGQVAADGRTYGFSYQSSFMGSTGSGAWVLSADGKSLTGNTYDSRGLSANWYLTRLVTP